PGQLATGSRVPDGCPARTLTRPSATGRGPAGVGGSRRPAGEVRGVLRRGLGPGVLSWSAGGGARAGQESRSTEPSLPSNPAASGTVSSGTRLPEQLLTSFVLAR